MTKLLRLPEVAAMTGIPEATLRFWRHQSTNPKLEERRQIGPRSANLGGRRVVYREADVIAWIDSQFEDGTPAA